MKRSTIILTILLGASFALNECPKSHPYPFGTMCKKCSSGARDRSGRVLSCTSEMWNPAGSVTSCSYSGTVTVLCSCTGTVTALCSYIGTVTVL